MDSFESRGDDEMNYELNAVRVFVTDFDRALAFYTDSLGMQSAFASRESGWAQFETGSAQLAIERVDPSDEEGNELVGRFVSVSLRVDDLQTTYETLRGRGVEFVDAPTKQPWGGSLAHLRDPDENILTLLEA